MAEFRKNLLNAMAQVFPHVIFRGFPEVLSSDEPTQRQIFPSQMAHNLVAPNCVAP